jgi:hypothetical protein
MSLNLRSVSLIVPKSDESTGVLFSAGIILQEYDATTGAFVKNVTQVAIVSDQLVSFHGRLSF